jgi:hypothetical protein
VFEADAGMSGRAVLRRLPNIAASMCHPRILALFKRARSALYRFFTSYCRL